jgi:peptidoglycan/LPS O-acetylase OafA/YrhL
VRTCSARSQSPARRGTPAQCLLASACCCCPSPAPMQHMQAEVNSSDMLYVCMGACCLCTVCLHLKCSLICMSCVAHADAVAWVMQPRHPNSAGYTFATSTAASLQSCSEGAAQLLLQIQHMRRSAKHKRAGAPLSLLALCTVGTAAAGTHESSTRCVHMAAS